MLGPKSGAQSPDGPNPKVVGAIVGAVALVLLIVLIRLFACSGGMPNLVDLVTKQSTEAAGTVKGYKEMTLAGETVYTDNEDFVKDLATAGEGDVETLKRYGGSYYFVLYGSDNNSLTLDDISNGSDPDHAMLVMLVANGKLTAKGAADRVAQIAPYDKVYACKSASGDYIQGGAKGNGCVSAFAAHEHDGVWDLAVYTYAIDTSGGSYHSADFDSEYERFDSSNYVDSYKE